MGAYVDQQPCKWKARVIKIFYPSSTAVGRSARRAGEGFFQRFPFTPLRRMLLGSIDIARLKNKVSTNEQS
jgi:hypothetical protein